MKKMKQSIALLLATTMLSGTMAATAFAANGSTSDRQSTDNTDVYSSGSTEYSYLEVEAGENLTLGVETPLLVYLGDLTFTNGDAAGFGTNASSYSYSRTAHLGYYANIWNTTPQTLGNYQFYSKYLALTYKNWDVNVVHTHTVTYETPNGTIIDIYSEKQMEENVYPTHDLMDNSNYDAWIVSEVGSLYGGDLEVGEYLELDEAVSIQDDITLQGVVTATFSAHEDENWVDVEIRTGVDGALDAPDEEPELLGHTFEGWALGRVIDEFPTTIDTATEYVAAWTVGNYLVTYEDGVETEEITVPDESTITYDTEVTVDAMIPIYGEYVFTGWLADFDNTTYTASETFSMPAENVTLTATWSGIDVALSYDLNGGSWSLGDDYFETQTTGYEGTSAFDIITEVPTRSGYTFLGWSLEDSSDFITDSYVIGTNTTLVAQWDKNSSNSKSYYIKATATGKGTVSPEGEDVSPDSMYKVAKLSDVTFAFDADSGYEVTDVIVNGKSVGALDEYEFEDIIITMQTLEVVFEKSSSSSSDDDEDEEHEDEEDDETTEEIELPFADVDADDDNFDGIAYVYENGIMAGITSEVFGSELSITRAMIAAILYRIDGSESVDADMSFADVTEDQYYYEAVKWGKDTGVIAGMSATEFAPNTAITTEQFLAFLYRYAAVLDMDTDIVDDTDLSDYAISAYAYTAIAWALENDIIDEDDLQPQTEALRGDVATALMNFMEMM